MIQIGQTSLVSRQLRRIVAENMFIASDWSLDIITTYAMEEITSFQRPLSKL